MGPTDGRTDRRDAVTNNYKDKELRSLKAAPTWIRRGDGSAWGQNSFNWNPWAPKMEVFPYTAPSNARPSFITRFQMDAQQSNSFANSRNLEHIHIG